MFTQRQTGLEKALLSAVAVLFLLVTAGQSATLTDDLQPTATPAPSNSSMEEPRVLHTYRSCRSEHANYCENGGECMYPQDSDKPFCICPSSYSGTRCLFFSDHTHIMPESEQLIAISVGVVMFIFVLAIIIFCFSYKRCIKSASLIKSVPETSV